MATKIVKASDPDIIKLGANYRGYYFNPITNKAYSDMVPCYGPERLYELKPSPTGKFRFRDRTMTTYEIHAVVKSQNPTSYSQIMATHSEQPKTRKLPDNLKVRIHNEQEFNKVDAALKKDGRDWRFPGQHYLDSMKWVLTSHQTIEYSALVNYTGGNIEMTVAEILEIMNEPTVKQSEAKRVFKSFKIKCKNWDQAEQIIEKLKAESYHPVNPKWQAKHEYNVNGIIALPYGTYDWFSYIGVDSTFSDSNAPEITFEEYCGSKSAQTQQTSPSKGWIIGNLDAKSKIEISDNPRIHSTIDSAETERLRLMNAHVGETFVILEIKSYGKVETNPVTKIW